MMPDHYHHHGRAAQQQAFGRARHWLDRLTQLTMFENVVLRGPDGSDREHGQDRRDGEEGRPVSLH